MVFLAECNVMSTNTFTVICKIVYILMFASHNQLHMFGFSDMANFLGSAPPVQHRMCDVKHSGLSPVKHESQ